MHPNDVIYVAGHRGMVGSAISRYLRTKGFTKILEKERKELDLQNKQIVKDFFQMEKPRFVFLAAAKVGGIQANIAEPVEFLVNNLEIQINIIEQSYLSGVQKILILGSSCIYPKICPQPMKEENLLSGPLEPTNEGYALSKIVALKLGEYYHREKKFHTVSLMPPNLYGPNDSFDLEKSHVLSALVRRFVDARDENRKKITLWGTGKARREFMHVDDVARASCYFLEHLPPGEFVNIGWGVDISIYELATQIAAITKYNGSIEWDSTKPDGMMKKCLDVSRMRKLGFGPKISLEEGLYQMVALYEEMKAGVNK